MEAWAPKNNQRGPKNNQQLPKTIQKLQKNGDGTGVRVRAGRAPIGGHFLIVFGHF